MARAAAAVVDSDSGISSVNLDTPSPNRHLPGGVVMRQGHLVTSGPQQNAQMFELGDRASVRLSDSYAVPVDLGERFQRIQNSNNSRNVWPDHQ